MRTTISQLFPGFAEADWWSGTSFDVRWSARRHAESPIVAATGEILTWLEAEGEDYAEDAVPCGTVSIAKIPLSTGCDALLAADDQSADYVFLLTDILTGETYSDDFLDWFEESFGVHATGDPLLITDVSILPEHRTLLQPAATYAVLEAAAAFASADSPIIGFAPNLVDTEVRSESRRAGLCAWAKPLRARRLKQVLVAVRPSR